MIVDDQAEAEFYLQHLNYYRLCAYWLPFEADHASHRFRDGARFAEVLNLYIFDRELRLLLLDGIERIEVSVRSQWAYQLAHRHGPHAHLDPALSRKRGRWRENLDRLTDEVERSKEVFIRHMVHEYEEPLPPVWAVCEVMSLGQLSRWFDDLKPMPSRRAIARVYRLDDEVLASWLRHLTQVRNVCAHHNRLWNREFTVTAAIPRSKPTGLGEQFNAASRRVYNALVIAAYFLDQIAPRHHWRKRLTSLLSEHGIDPAEMGFPPGWEDSPIWKERAP